MRAVTPIELDTKRVLIYGTADGVAVERLLGNESIEEALQKRGLQRLVAFIWGGLRHENDKLTQDRVMKMIDKSPLNYVELWGVVSDALINSGILSPPSEKPDPSQAQPPGPTPP